MKARVSRYIGVLLAGALVLGVLPAPNPFAARTVVASEEEAKKREQRESLEDLLGLMGGGGNALLSRRALDANDPREQLRLREARRDREAAFIPPATPVHTDPRLTLLPRRTPPPDPEQHA